MKTMHLNSRTARVMLGVLAAVLCAATATPVAASAATATASATPSTNLHSGDVVTISVTGFPANSAVSGVQCDERVLTGNAGYCDIANVAIIMTDAAGAGSAQFTVKAAADFVSANGKGVCDARHACELALQSQGGGSPSVALVGLSFAAQSDSTLPSTVYPCCTKTKTAVASPKKKYVARSAARIKVTVTEKSEGTPTGRVVVKDNGKVIARVSLPASGRVKVTRKLSKGVHKITARYSGDAVFAASRGSVKLVAKPTSRSK
jgi:hypothetical protein